MTAYEIWAEALVNGNNTTREKIDEYFRWVATAVLADQIALELSSNDGIFYADRDGIVIEVTE
jgi:hypothetical protein